MIQKTIAIFVCEHGAAKSIIAAAYYNKLAFVKNLNTHAFARGTHPDTELSPKAITGLLQDGLIPAEAVPQKLTLMTVESAQHIVAFCELPSEYKNKIPIETWDDIPPVSDSYEIARDAIMERVKQIIQSICNP